MIPVAKKLPYSFDSILYLSFSLSTVSSVSSISSVSSVSSVFLTLIKMTIPQIIITKTNIRNNDEINTKKNKYFSYI